MVISSSTTTMAPIRFPLFCYNKGCCDVEVSAVVLNDDHSLPTLFYRHSLLKNQDPVTAR